MFAEELTEIDFQILDYVSKNGTATIQDLHSHFLSIDVLDYRLQLLSRGDIQYIGPGIPVCIDDTYFLEAHFDQNRNISAYSITNIGRKSLQDHLRKVKSDRKELWLKNAWIPILVSLATNLILDASKQLPLLIQQWLSSSL